jgi:hypothetical protein
VPETSTIYATIQSLREKARGQLLLLAWDPSGVKQKVLWQQLGKLPKGARAVLISQMSQVQTQLQGQQKLLRLAEKQKEVTKRVKAQLEALAREQSQLQKMLRELGEESTETIAEKLRDEQPLIRWLAVQVAGRKRLPLEGALVEMLSDPVPLVREAARQALVRLSRGNDFGPTPGADAAQVAHSLRAWRQWLDYQERPASPGDSQRDRIASEQSRRE